MASLRAIALAMVGGAISVATLSAFVAGCGGDDTATGDGGGSPDATSITEAGNPDVGQPDVVTHAEAGVDAKADSTTPVEAGHDADAATTAVDADAAVAHDADAAAAHDGDAGAATDASDADAVATEASAEAEAGPTTTPAQQFAMAYAQAYCQGYLHCCDGYDAGAVNFNKCVTDSYGQVSQETTFPLGAASALTGTHLTIDQDAAAGCFAGLSNLACVIAAADNAAATNPCFGVISGNIPLGGTGCVTSFECVTGGYCNIGDGGTGTCTALAGDGGTCVTQDMCSAAQLQPTSYCTTVDTGNPTGTCAPLLPDNSMCGSDMECTAEFCFAGAGMDQCGGSGVLNTSNGLCQTYAVDAGGD